MPVPNEEWKSRKGVPRLMKKEMGYMLCVTQGTSMELDPREIEEGRTLDNVIQGAGKCASWTGSLMSTWQVRLLQMFTRILCVSRELMVTSIFCGGV